MPVCDDDADDNDDDDEKVNEKFGANGMWIVRVPEHVWPVRRRLSLSSSAKSE